MAEIIIFSNKIENDLSYSFDIEYKSDLGFQPDLSKWSFRYESFFETSIFINQISLLADKDTDSYTCEYLGINKYHITLYGKLFHYGTFILTISYSNTINEITTNYEIISDKLLSYLPPKFLFGEIKAKQYNTSIGSNDLVIPYNIFSIPSELLSSNSAYPYFEQNYELSGIFDQTSGERPNYYENDYLYTNGLHYDSDKYLSGNLIKSSNLLDNIYQVNCSRNYTSFFSRPL